MPSIIKRTVAGAAVGGAAIWGIGGIDDTTRDNSGQIIESGDLGVFVTQLGDCFNLADPQANLVSTTNGVPCSDPHHWQVIFKGSITSDSYDASEFDREAQLVCKYAIDEIAQTISYEESLEYENAQTNYFVPTEESFAEGDRAIDCLVGSDSEYYTSSLLD
ncbi:MAG: hypothetical protein RJB54_318 [Actinomycetota bacterium]|jgi:hypothetical protein